MESHYRISGESSDSDCFWPTDEEYDDLDTDSSHFCDNCSIFGDSSLRCDECWDYQTDKYSSLLRYYEVSEEVEELQEEIENFMRLVCEVQIQKQKVSDVGIKNNSRSQPFRRQNKNKGNHRYMKNLSKKLKKSKKFEAASQKNSDSEAKTMKWFFCAMVVVFCWYYFW